jgi:hypothetical protein
MIMVHTLQKSVLREILADTIRTNAGAAPGDLADQILETLKTYSPKAFIDERVDVEAGDKFVEIARAMITTAAFNIDEWEIKAAYPRLSDEEASNVNDLIGLAGVTVEF